MPKKYIFLLAILALPYLAYPLEVDSLDNSAVWNVTASSGTTATLSSGIGKIGNALSIDCDLKVATNPVIDVFREDFGFLDTSQNSADALRFRFKGEGNDNNLEVNVQDNDGDIFGKKFFGITGSPGFQEMVVSFENGNNPVSFLFNAFGNSNTDKVLNRQKVTKISFVVSRDTTTQNPFVELRGEGGQGAITIDQVELYRQTTAQNTLVFDDFDDRENRNSLGGLAGPFSAGGTSDPTLTLSTAAAHSGRRGLAINYSFPIGQFCGYFSLATVAGDTGQRDLSSYANLEFWVKGQSGGEKFKVEFKNSSGKQSQMQITDFLVGGVTATYQKVSIPVSTFTITSTTNPDPPPDLTAIRSINIVFDQSPFNGTIYLDDMNLTKTGSSDEDVIAVLDTMDDPSAVSSWKKFADREDQGFVVANLASVAGSVGNALKLNYRFQDPSGAWAEIERDWGLNLTGENTFSFLIAGTDKANNLTFRVVDKNNTIYQRKFFAITNTSGEWKELAVPYQELSLFQSGTFSNGDSTSNLDLTEIKGFHWLITKNEGGSGTLKIDELQAFSPVVSEQIKGGGNLIQQVSVTNNPFSPNGDGVKDTTIFNYRLGTSANVKFYIYNLQGNRIKKLEDTEKNPGTFGVEWDGRDDDGDKVLNGLYIYQIEADNHSGGEEKFRQVIGVIR